MLSRRFLDFSVGVGAFVIGLSQISSFPPNNAKKQVETKGDDERIPRKC